MEEQFVDIERLRRKLKDYYGTAMFSASPMAMMDLAKVEKASAEELFELAQKCGINIDSEE